MDIFLTIFSMIGTALLSCGLLALYMRRTIPVILQDVAADIGEQFGEIFEKPSVKHAMSILGKKSGEVRHDAAAENALAEGLLNNVAPEIRMILDRIDPNLIENYGAETIMNLAAKYMPTIKKFLGGGTGGLSLDEFMPNKKGNFKSRF